MRLLHGWRKYHQTTEFSLLHIHFHGRVAEHDRSVSSSRNSGCRLCRSTRAGILEHIAVHSGPAHRGGERCLDCNAARHGQCTIPGYSPLIGNLVGVMLFITPIFWEPSQLGAKARYVVDPNYFYHLIDILRSPLLGDRPAMFSYVITIVAAILGWVATLMIYARFRRRLAFWL